MPANQKRDTSRRRLEQQLALREQRQHELARRRMRITASAAGAAALVAVIVIAVAVASGGKSHPHAAASPSPSSTTSGFQARKTSGPCGYTTANTSTNPALKNVGLPPDPAPTPRKVLTIAFATNRGVIEATLDGTVAPCNVQSLVYLIEQKFYDNTPCPRVVNSSIYVVQCGSGGATTSGGPTYTVPDENLAEANYAAGAIAMANNGQPHTASSQFFFITKDSNSGLAKSYTMVGHVTKGLNILQSVAAGGNDSSAGSAGGGAPKLALSFKTVTVIGVTGGGPTPGVGASPTLVATATS